MNEFFNPEMLILARESREMSQAVLARALCVTQGKISKFENGMLLPSADEIKRLASILDYTPDLFVQRDVVYGLGSSFLFHRQRKAVPLVIQRKIQAEINILRMQVTRLLKGVEIDAHNSFEPLDVDAHDGDVEKIAQLVRASWRLPLGPIGNVTASIESAGGIVLRCRFQSKLIDGAHLWLPGLPPLFFVNRDLPGDRLRWTLAHELGHAIMHKNPTGAIEQEANDFAAEFLLPRGEVENHLGDDLSLQKAASLKTIWKVSMAAIVKRAFDINAISESKYRRLFTSLSANGYRTNEPFPIDPEEPKIVRHLVAIHRGELGYDNFDLAKLLFAPDPQFFEGTDRPAILHVGEQPFFAFFSGDDPPAPLRLKIV